MAHSIKGMAGSLGYDAITELSHKLEDAMEGFRAAGTVPAGEHGMALLFAGLEGLETMVAAVRGEGEPAAPDEALLRRLQGVVNPSGQGPQPGGREPDPKKASLP